MTSTKRQRTEDTASRKRQRSTDTLAATLVVSGLLPPDIYAPFEELWSLHPAERGKVIIMSKKVSTPRWQQSYINDYHFSGMSHLAQELPIMLIPLLQWANSLKLGTFNQVLINWYNNGADYIGPHSDDERQLVAGSPILSLSLGATRIFRIQPKPATGQRRDIALTDRSYLVMKSPMQSLYKHSIVKVGGDRGLQIGRRINVTFRQFQ